MSNSSEISGNGRRFALTWCGQAGPLWIIFPGVRYRLGDTGLARVREVALRSGAQVCGVATDYDRDPRVVDLPQDKAVELLREDSRVILAQLPKAQVLVGKSAGCLALWEGSAQHAQSGGDHDGRYVWITPNLTHPPLRKVITDHAPHSFIIAGAQDPATPAKALVQAGAPNVQLRDMGHDLTTGSPDQDAPIFDDMDAALRDWI